MSRIIKKTIAMLIAVSLIIGCAPIMLRVHAAEVTETLDLADTEVFDVVGTNVVTKQTDTDGNTYYEFNGGGTNTYNKITTKKSYSGNIVLSYDIQFESTDTAEMILATPRGNHSADTSKQFPSSITSNFVLHTSSSGMRVNYTKADGSGNVSGRSATDSTMSNSYNDQKTGTWYSVKLVVTEDNYYGKFWPAGSDEPETNNCTLAAADGDLTEGIVGFAKRGTGKALLRNVQVSYTETAETGDDFAHTMSFPQGSTEWIHNEAGTFESGTDGEDEVIILGGGGTDKFNKIISTTAFSGDMSMEFEVKFSSDANEEMLKFTPRMDPISTDTSAYSGVCGNFVLHTADSKGLRLSNSNKTVVTDKSIYTNNWNPTDTWYTVKFEIKGDVYKVKFWPSESEEPSSWNCTYTFTDVAESGSIAFMKRGTGTLQLKNIQVSYDTVVSFEAVSVGDLDPKTVPYGTAFSDLELPASVDVLGENNALRHVNVTWDEDTYSSTATGAQTVTGTLDLTAEENPDNLVAEVQVTVLPEGVVLQTTRIISYGENSDITTYHQFGTITTKAGTILATCEARVGGGDADNPSSIALWRSTDGGKTWSDTIIVADYAQNKCSETENDCGKGIYGHFFANPTPVVDYETGKIFIFYSENFSNASSKLYYRTSTDDGVTWSAPTEVTSLFDSDPYDRAFHLPGPGHGLQIESGEYEGRLVVEVWHRHTVSLASANRQYGLSVIYSDDGGATWKNSEYIDIGYHMNEGRVAQLAGGTLVINSRSTDNTRKQTYSTDGGATWSTPTTWTSIGSYGNCDSGFTSQVEGDSTQLVTTHILNGTSVRNTLYAYLSYDNGATWSYSAQLWSEPSIDSGTGASDVNRISEDTYGAVHGTTWSKNDVEFVVFSTAALTGLADDSSIVPTYVAQVGITNYTTLAAAVETVSEGGNIVIRSDISTEESVELGKQMTIDLNGHTLWTDLNSLCAEGYAATYSEATGLWTIAEGSASIEIFVENMTGETAGATITAPADGWAEGTNTFTVSCDNACVVAISNDNGASYTRLAATSTETEGTYSFTAENVGADTKIAIVKIGDADGNGEIAANDAAVAKGMNLESITDATVQQLLAVDLNGDGAITANEVAVVKAATLGNVLSW